MFGRVRNGRRGSRTEQLGHAHRSDETSRVPRERQHARRFAPARVSPMRAVIQHVNYEGQGNIALALRRARLRSVNFQFPAVSR
jgi:hypothetical protein